MNNDISGQVADLDSLFLNNFISLPSQNSQRDVPVTQFAPGSPISLKWHSNGFGFKLYAKGDPNTLYAGVVPYIDLPQGFQTTTTLMLVALLQQEKQYAFLTIVISDPPLRPDGMTVSNGMSNAGALTIQNTLQAKSTLVVNGMLDLKDNTSFQDIVVSLNSNISGTANLNNASATMLGVSNVTMGAESTLSLPNNTNVTRADIDDCVLASGSSTFGKVTVNGNISMDAIRIAMLGQLQRIVSFQGAVNFETSIQATTDGFAIATVNPDNCSLGTIAYGIISYEGQDSYAAGAALYESQSNSNASRYGYCCVPIRNGSSWTFKRQTGGNGTPPAGSLYWMPLGGSTNIDSYEITEEKQLTDTDIPAPVPVPIPDSVWSRASLHADFLRTLTDAQRNVLPPEPVTPLSCPTVLHTGFTLSDLLVSQQDTLLTEFNANTPITLSWDSTGTYFKLFSDNQPTPLYEGTNKTFDLPRGIIRDTTFTVEATLDNIRLYKSVTVTVRNPTLTPYYVSVAGNHSITGDMVTEGAATLNDLTVNGLLRYDGPLKIDGSFFVHADINVAGNTTIPNAIQSSQMTVNGSLQVKGIGAATHLHAPQLKVSGMQATTVTTDSLVIQKQLKLTGGVSMFNEGSTIYKGGDVQKQFVAHSDGYLLGNVQLTAMPHAYAGITITIGDDQFSINGGNVAALGSNGQNLALPTPSTLLLPIAKGTTLTYTISNGNEIIENVCTATLSWYPVCAGNNLENTYEIREIPPDKKIDPHADWVAAQKERLETATAFIENIARGSGKTIDPATRQLLIEKLLAFR